MYFSVKLSEPRLLPYHSSFDVSTAMYSSPSPQCMVPLPSPTVYISPPPPPVYSSSSLPHSVWLPPPPHSVCLPVVLVPSYADITTSRGPQTMTSRSTEILKSTNRPPPPEDLTQTGPGCQHYQRSGYHWGFSCVVCCWTRCRFFLHCHYSF